MNLETASWDELTAQRDAGHRGVVCFSPRSANYREAYRQRESAENELLSRIAAAEGIARYRLANEPHTNINIERILIDINRTLGFPEHSTSNPAYSIYTRILNEVSA